MPDSSDTTNPQHLFSEVPAHLAIIMDGNSRWAKHQGKSTPSGHRAGVETVRKVLKLCRQQGISIVTLFAFSSENWQRPRPEVKALMLLFSSYLKKEVQQLHKDAVRVRFIGSRQQLSANLIKQMELAEQLTANNTDTTLVIAVDYGGQWDITNAARQLAEQVQAGTLQPADINESLLNQYTALADLPKPDLCIRTAGEHRISNFLLWQLAYSELYFSDTLWPDFSAVDIAAALTSFNERERRFGGRIAEDNYDDGWTEGLESEALSVSKGDDDA
ncbi:MAG: undecaprenyl diphosphate synthase [Oceanicoccus sp.]|jgi:undecaprenyl diphosphate synthase